jgi:hypothetical protein
MGKVHQPLNTFWQMFYRPPSGGRWALVTPPGVADNGGLVADDGPGSTVTAGFEPNQLLTFSPVAQTMNAGRNWSPGLLPAGLLPVPDAVATEPDGNALALVKAPGGSVLRSASSLSSWHTLVRGSALAATSAGRACGLVALRAVTVAAGDPEVAGACSRPGVVGVFTQIAGSWQAARLRLTGAIGASTTSVLRLQSSAAGTAGLVEAGGGSASALVAIWRAGPLATWSVSAPIRLRGHLVATGFGAGGQLVVETDSGQSGLTVVSVAGPGAAWVALPPPPKGTAAVVAGPGGTFDALTVASNKLVDWRFDPARSRWLRTQELTVPVEYGSSQ